MEVAEIFKRFKELNILIIGDVMIDRYLTGEINRISPEAPVPVLQHKSSENRLGGAANVALNIAALGATPILLSVIGEDENGIIFQKLMPKYNLSAEGIILSKSRQTTTKTRVLAANQHILRVDREDTFDLEKSEEELLLKQFNRIVNEKSIDLILFQDYNKGVLSVPVIKRIIKEANNREIPTAVDPKKKNFWAYEGISFFKPNLKEIQEGLDSFITPTLSSLQNAGKSIRSRLKNSFTLITLSEKGLYYDTEKSQAIIPTRPRDIRDVCGAGDTVISVAAACFALGLSAQETSTLANLAGGQVCEKVGVVPLDKAQLQKEYNVLLSE